MPNTVVDGAVVIYINPAVDNTTVQVNVTGNFGAAVPGISIYVLEYDHPGYSPIYTLLMASGASQKPVDLIVNSDDNTIQEARYVFVRP